LYLASKFGFWLLTGRAERQRQQHQKVLDSLSKPAHAQDQALLLLVVRSSEIGPVLVNFCCAKNCWEVLEDSGWHFDLGTPCLLLDHGARNKRQNISFVSKGH
jgi:hypothetical protein